MQLELNTKDLGKWLTIAGAAGVAISFLWWMNFYSQVTSLIGKSLFYALGCLFFSSLECSAAQALAHIGGFWPYSPFYLWCSLGLLLAGQWIVKKNTGAGLFRVIEDQMKSFQTSNGGNQSTRPSAPTVSTPNPSANIKQQMPSIRTTIQSSNHTKAKETFSGKLAMASEAHDGQGSSYTQGGQLSDQFYRAEINRENPTCIIFVVDQSHSMGDLLAVGKSKAEFVADALNRTIYSLVTTCTKADGVRNYFDIAVIGYGDSGPAPGLSGALSGDYIHAVATIGDNPLRVEDRVRSDDDGAGGIIERRIKFPVWFEPRFNGGTPMRAALSEAHQLSAAWCVDHPKSYPPTIIHVTDGESTDGDPEDLANSIKSIGTTDGRCLLFNIHVSSNSVGSLSFPGDSAAIQDPYAQLLYRMSSELPAHICDRAREKGYRLAIGARGYVFNAEPKDIVNFFDIGTRPRNVADR